MRKITNGQTSVQYKITHKLTIGHLPYFKLLNFFNFLKLKMPYETRKTKALKKLKRNLSPHIRRKVARQNVIRSPHVIGDVLKTYMTEGRNSHDDLNTLLDRDEFLRRLRRFNPSRFDPQQFYDIKSLTNLGRKYVLDAINDNLLTQKLMKEKRRDIRPIDLAEKLYISNDDAAPLPHEVFTNYKRGVEMLHKDRYYMHNKMTIQNFLESMGFTPKQEQVYGFRMNHNNPYPYDEDWAKSNDFGGNKYTGAKKSPSRRILDERKKRIDTIYKVFRELVSLDSEYVKDMFTGQIVKPDDWRIPPQFMYREELQSHVRSMKRDLKLEKAAKKKSRKPAKKKSRKPAKKKSRKPAKKKSRKPAKKKSRKPAKKKSRKPAKKKSRKPAKKKSRQAPPSGVIKKENLPVGAVRVGADGKQKYVVYQVVSRGKNIKKWKKLSKK
jgi:hypothetical protein